MLETLRLPNWILILKFKKLQNLTDTKPTVAKALPFHQINLDKCALDERIRKDLVDYIHCRVETSHRIQDNITPVVPHLANKFLPEPSPQDRFVLYLTETSGGSFLFAKLILDLIERYRLSSFKGRGTKLARCYAKNQYTQRKMVELT